MIGLVINNEITIQALYFFSPFHTFLFMLKGKKQVNYLYKTSNNHWSSTFDLQNIASTLNYHYYPLCNEDHNFEKMMVTGDPISLSKYLKNGPQKNKFGI